MFEEILAIRFFWVLFVVKNNFQKLFLGTLFNNAKTK